MARPCVVCGSALIVSGRGKAGRTCSAPCSTSWQTALREKQRQKKRAADRAYYAENKEERAAYYRKWAAANAERQAAYKREHYMKNRDRYRTRAAEWKRRNPDRVSASNRRRKRRGEFSVAEFLARMAYWGNRCWMCGGPFEHVDHVKPLAAGGPHIIANLRPACASCNTSKSAQWPIPAKELI